MDTSQAPYLKPLAHRGFVQGCTISNSSHALCHFFGGVRYALPPAERWRKALKLPPSYSYGSRERPERHDRGAGVCPQPGFLGPPDESHWSEDCFQCNVWVPVGEPPVGGWPVLVYIHGGWLQFGTPNTFSVAALLGETDVKAVVVIPAYRLNVFGFLYSTELEQDAASVGESVGNHGFWDQRLALEWTRENVHLFGGNPANITLAGYSAGAYSVFHQLAYDLRLPRSSSLISRACIWSNGPGVQPKSPVDAQTQFTQLLSALHIPPTLSPSAKLARLRTTPPRTLVDAAASIRLHEFRPTTDSAFVSESLMQTLHDGSFARVLVDRNIRILLGECSDEHFLYGIWRPPVDGSRAALRQRLVADYPAGVVDAVLPFYTPSTPSTPSDEGEGENSLFGHIYANMQVHHLQRGLIHSLSVHGAGHLLSRYRIEFRLSCIDDIFPPEWGATHSTDMAIWFFGNGSRRGLTPSEEGVVKEGVLGPFARFVAGESGEFGWGAQGEMEVRVLRADGAVDVVRDEEGVWERALRIWSAIRGVSTRAGSRL